MVQQAIEEWDEKHTAMKAEQLKAAYQIGRRDFSRSHLQNVCLHKTRLADINFSDAYLNRAILSKAYLERACFNRAILYVHKNALQWSAVLKICRTMYI